MSAWEAAFFQSPPITWFLEKTHLWKPLWPALHALGMRLGNIDVRISFTENVADKWIAILTIASRDPIPPGTVGLSIIKSTKLPAEDYFQALRDESLDFSITTPRSNLGNIWPSASLTPHTSKPLQDAILHPDLTCLHTLSGCETGMQLIPKAHAAQTQLRADALERLSGSNPCPERIIRRRAQDAAWAITAQISSISERGENTTPVVRLTSILPLKGTPSIKNNTMDLWDGSWAFSQTKIPVMQRKPFLKAGNEILFLSNGYSSLDDSCGTLPATEENLRIVKEAIASASSG